MESMQIISIEKYHSGPGISKSHLDKIDISPKHYWAAYINPEREPRVASAEMIIGTAIHAAVLEPDTFSNECALAPEGINRRTNAGKEEWAQFERESAGKIILTPDDYKTVISARSPAHLLPKLRCHFA